MNDSPRALDLGSGPCPAAGYVGVDIFSQDSPRVLYAHLWDGTPWPFDDGTIRDLRASHVIEHIPHDRIRTRERTAVVREIRRPGGAPIVEHLSIPVTKEAFFWFFDEAFRVAEVGCRFELSWPHPQHDHADQDPTHCRRVPTTTLMYLSREGRRALRVHHYPVACDWRVESVTEIGTEDELKHYGPDDYRKAKRHHGVFHEIRALLVKPPEEK